MKFKPGDLVLIEGSKIKYQINDVVAEDIEIIDGNGVKHLVASAGEYIISDTSSESNAVTYCLEKRLKEFNP